MLYSELGFGLQPIEILQLLFLSTSEATPTDRSIGDREELQQHSNVNELFQDLETLLSSICLPEKANATWLQKDVAQAVLAPSINCIILHFFLLCYKHFLGPGFYLLQLNFLVWKSRI